MSFLSDIFKKPPVKFTLYGVNVCVAAQDRQLAEEVLNSLNAIPTGRNALAEMKENNVTLRMENSLGDAGGYFNPKNNEIVLSKSCGKNYMKSSLVHEARHVYQHYNGRAELESQNLDYASRLMINRATEADAQTEALQACLEWESQGDYAPLKRFKDSNEEIAAGFYKSKSLSDAFKGWYDNENHVAAYEHSYDVVPQLTFLTDEPDKRPFVSLKPSEIGEFCGAHRVDDFDGFMQSPKARQVNLLTKTVMQMGDIVAIANGAPVDKSINATPVRDLKGNYDAQIAAETFWARTARKFPPESTNNPKKKNLLTVLSNAMKAIDRINSAAAKGQDNPKAEADLQAALKRTNSVARDNPVKAFFTSVLSSGR